MRSQRIVRNLATLSFATATLLAVPGLASAQFKGSGTNTDPLSSKIVSLDIDDVDLYSALRVLFGKLKVNYTLDPALKQVRVAASLQKVSGQVALTSLLNASGKHFTYSIEAGVYNVTASQPKKTSGLSGFQ